MDPGDFEGGAFGGSRAGGTQDPMDFVKRPMVILRLIALISAIIVFGCVSSQGWQYDRKSKSEMCIMNGDASCCHFATFVGLIGFAASIGFIVGEWFFEQMSSVKTRKHYVLGDLGFSGTWAFFYFVAFAYMSSAWSKTDREFEYGSGNILGAIFFSFISIACWAACSFMAFRRFKSGIDSTFTSNVGVDDSFEDGMPVHDGNYQAYPDAAETSAYESTFGGDKSAAGYQRQPNY